MRRSMGGLFLIIGGVSLALCAGLWWMQRVAFTPSGSTDSAVAVLADDAIRGEIATVIAASAAPSLNQSPTELKEFVEAIARIRDGAALMSPFIVESHQRLIGDRDDPVTVTAAQQVTIVRDEQAATSPPVTLTVPEVGTYATIHSIAWWSTIITGVAGLLLIAFGIILRPERGEGRFALSVTFGALAISLIVFGYLIPLAMLPAFSDSVWAGIFPALANEHRLTTLVVAAVSAGLGAAVFLLGGSRQRRQWSSTPLGVGRSREQHTWSR